MCVSLEELCQMRPLFRPPEDQTAEIQTPPRPEGIRHKGIYFTSLI